MSIQKKTRTSKRTGKEITQFYAVVYDKTKEKNIWSKGFLTEREAKKAERELIVDIDAGQHLYDKKNFSEITDLWKVSSKSQYSNSTYQGYIWYLDKHIIPVFGDVRTDKIQPIHVEKYKNAMLEKYSSATVNKAVNLLSVIMDYAKDTLHVCTSNPCSNIKRAKIGNPKTTTWSEDDISYFLSCSHVKKSPYYDMLIISFSTGIRPGELCGLAESDYVDGSITLNRALDRYGKLSDMKTSGSHRRLDLPKQICRFLDRRLRYKKELRLHFGAKYTNDFLFVHEDGAMIQPNVYSKAFKSLLKRHNEYVETLLDCNGSILPPHRILPDIRLYDARHSFATNNILNNSVPVKVISDTMGNQVKTCLHNYSHATQGMSQAAIGNYSEKILGIR